MACGCNDSAGEIVASYLTTQYAGLPLLVPLGPEAYAGRKRRANCGRLAVNQSNQQMARDLHCHVRAFERERECLRSEGDDRQDDLFADSHRSARR